jgi:hypothetical protein
VGKIANIYMTYGNPKKFVQVAKLAIGQFKGLNPQSASDVRADLKANFELTDQQLEVKLEDGLDIIVEGFDLVNKNLKFVNKLKNYISDFKEVEQRINPDNVSVA